MASDIAEKKLFFNNGPEGPGGAEDIKDNKEALAVNRELTSEEVQNIVDTIGRQIEGVSEDQKNQIADMIRKFTTESNLPLMVEMQNLSTELDTYLSAQGIEGKGIEFDFSQIAKQPDANADMGLQLDLNAMQGGAFEDGKDNLQNKLEQKSSDERTTGYIDPNEGLVYFENGERKTDPSVNVEDTILMDLSLENSTEITESEAETKEKKALLREIVLSPVTLEKAVQSAYPESKFGIQDAEIIYGALHGMLEFGDGEGQTKISELQKAFANISPDFAAIVNGADNKYGKGTREAVRTLAAQTRNMVDTYNKDVSGRIDLKFEVKVVPKAETVKLYQQYDEVHVLADHSGSMSDDVRFVAKDIASKKDWNTKFSFSTFEQGLNVVHGLQEGQEGLGKVVKSMENMRTTGGTEYGITNALRLMQSDVFTKDEYKTVTNPETGETEQVQIKRLLEIFTDENLQGLKVSEIIELAEMAKEHNADVMIAFSNGKEINRVPLQVLVEMYVGSPERIQALQMAKMHETQIIAKADQVQYDPRAQSIDGFTSVTGDTQWEAIQAENEAMQQTVQAARSKIDAMEFGADMDMADMKSYEGDTAWEALQEQNNALKAQKTAVSQSITTLQAEYKNTTEPAQRGEIIQQIKDQLATLVNEKGAPAIARYNEIGLTTQEVDTMLNNYALRTNTKAFELKNTAVNQLAVTKTELMKEMFGDDVHEYIENINPRNMSTMTTVEALNYWNLKRSTKHYLITQKAIDHLRQTKKDIIKEALNPEGQELVQGMRDVQDATTILDDWQLRYKTIVAGYENDTKITGSNVSIEQITQQAKIWKDAQQRKQNTNIVARN